MNWNRGSYSVVALALCLIAAAPAYAKKKPKEPDLFDACPVSETIRVASEASIEGLQSLAACDDVEVAPAEPGDLERMRSIQIRPPHPEAADFDVAYPIAATESDTVDPGGNARDVAAETALQPLPPKGKGKATPTTPSNPALAKAKAAVPEITAFSSATAGNGATYFRIVPQQAEVDYSGFSNTAAQVQPGATTPQAMPTGGALTGDFILAMRPVRYQTSFDEMISDTAKRHRIDPLLLHAVIKQESGYRQLARSHVGAQGLMQIMPGTGALLGVHRDYLNDPATNVDAGARLLRKLAIKYEGDFDLVLAAYNAGEGAVAKYGNRIPPYRETQDYVRRVMGNYYQLLNDNIVGGVTR
jgi:soluble lytic murein transglycosylase-like protein